MDKKSTITFFDGIAQKWDSLKSPIFDARIPRHIKNIALKEGDKVADIACGTGILYPFLQAAKAGEIFCLDISPNMIAELKRKYPEAAAYAQDFETAALPQNHFDKVLLFNALPHFDDVNLVMQKAYGMLKEGGVFVIFHSLTRSELQNIHGKQEEVQEDELPPQSELRAAFTAAGFKDIILKEDEFGVFFSGVK